MKNKTKTQLLWGALVVLVLVVLYMYQNPKVVEVPVGVPMMPVPPRPMVSQERPRSPEFREPPIKQYKPGHTTTGGENLYPLPVSHDSRNCMDDIGCQELYGNESVSVTGKTGSFNVNLYRTDDFF